MLVWYKLSTHQNLLTYYTTISLLNFWHSHHFLKIKLPHTHTHSFLSFSHSLFHTLSLPHTLISLFSSHFLSPILLSHLPLFPHPFLITLFFYPTPTHTLSLSLTNLKKKILYFVTTIPIFRVWKVLPSISLFLSLYFGLFFLYLSLLLSCPPYLCIFPSLLYTLLRPLLTYPTLLISLSHSLSLFFPLEI